MSKPTFLQVAIDGPAASGKTTVARRVARRLEALYLDTGALYRALAHLALRSRVDADNESALLHLWENANVSIDVEPQTEQGFRIRAEGAPLDAAVLQSNEVTAVVSTVAAHPRVRAALLASQRSIADGGAVVMAGRDIGTVVLPQAAVKIFLTASVAARVERRRAQLRDAGVRVRTHQLAQEIEERDRLDRERATSPLAPAPDAHVVDSSEMSIEEVVAEILAVVERAR
jgi:cytidylate kinase